MCRTEQYFFQDNGTEQPTGPPTKERFSYGGEKARTADLDALRLAKEMQAEGVADETIRQQTGWFVGRDGKWRFEIDDSGMRYDETGDMRKAESAKWAQEDFESARDDLWDHADMDTLNKVRAYNRADIAGDMTTKQSLYDELISGPYAYYFGQYTEALDRAREMRGAPAGGTLQDYIDHPALYEAYPQLKNVGLRFERMTDGTKGYYNRAEGEIVLDNSMRYAPEDSLIHEIQHTIQEVEGFARGSSPDYWQQRQDGERPVTQYGEKIRDAEQQMTQILEKLPPSFAEQFQRYSELSETDPRAGEQLADELMNGPYGDLFDEYYFRNMCLKDWRKYDWKRGPVELYRNTAGEIEARDAANRRTMSAEERENTAPDRGGEDVVFADETGWIRKNYDPETSSIKEQIANNRDRLNKMDPVANITVPINLYNTSSALKWAVDYLKATGYRVDRQGFGTIWFQEAEINNGLNYADTPEERAALALLPRILKRGIEIGRHGDHKLRQKETITFAAPAVVNGSTVHMAAVVSAYKNRYYAHRVVLPDGTVFRFSENKENDATQEPLRGVPISESLAKATSAASSTRISHGTDSVKEHFSVEDSASEEAKDSYSVLPAKARDYVKRAERTLLEKIGKVLSIPKAARRDFLAETVRAITNEYLQNGTVSKQTIDGLFEQAYAQGVVADEEFYRQYEHIKKHMRDTAVTLAEQGLLSVLSVAESA